MALLMDMSWRYWWTCHGVTGGHVDMSWRYWWTCHGVTGGHVMALLVDMSWRYCRVLRYVLANSCVLLLVFTAVACVMGVTVLTFVTFVTLSTVA